MKNTCACEISVHKSASWLSSMNRKLLLELFTTEKFAKNVTIVVK